MRSPGIAPEIAAVSSAVLFTGTTRSAGAEHALTPDASGGPASPGAPAPLLPPPVAVPPPAPCPPCAMPPSGEGLLPDVDPQAISHDPAKIIHATRCARGRACLIEIDRPRMRAGYLSSPPANRVAS